MITLTLHPRILLLQEWYDWSIEDKAPAIKRDRNAIPYTKSAGGIYHGDLMNWEKASNETDPNKIDDLIKNGDINLLYVICWNPYLLDRHVQILVDHNSARIRGEIAQNGDLTPANIQLLLKDPDKNVRDKLLLNKGIPIDIMKMKIATGSSSEKEALALNPSVPKDIWATWLQDQIQTASIYPNVMVRFWTPQQRMDYIQEIAQRPLERQANGFFRQEDLQNSLNDIVSENSNWFKWMNIDQLGQCIRIFVDIAEKHNWFEWAFPRSLARILPISEQKALLKNPIFSSHFHSNTVDVILGDLPDSEQEFLKSVILDPSIHTSWKGRALAFQIKDQSFKLRAERAIEEQQSKER